MTRYLVVSLLPPPVHGFAEMMLRLSESLEEKGTVKRINTASKARPPLLRHVLQLLRNASAAAAILTSRRSTDKIVIGCNGGLGLMYSALHVSIACIRGTSTTLHHHAYSYIDRRSIFMSFVCWIGGRQLRHVFLSPLMQRSFEETYGRKVVGYTLPNATFVSSTKSSSEVQPVIRIGLLSNLTAEKGLHEFIDLASEAHQRGLPVKLTLAGPIQSEDDRTKVRKAEGEGLLHWLGPLYGREKEEYFSELDLFVFPTKYRFEAQPTVIYEALAAHVPVIAYRRGCIGEQVQDCLSALPLESAMIPWTITEIVRQIEMSRSERGALKDKAFARYEQDYQAGRATLSSLFEEAADA